MQTLSRHLFLQWTSQEATGNKSGSRTCYMKLAKESLILVNDKLIVAETICYYFIIYGLTIHKYISILSIINHHYVKPPFHFAKIQTKNILCLIKSQHSKSHLELSH